MPYCQIMEDYLLDYAIAEYPDLDPDISFLKGSLISATLSEPLVFEVSGPPDGRPGHLLGRAIPVVTKQFINVLTKAGIDNFQTFSATLINQETKFQWPDYFAFNAIGLIDSSNMERSLSDIIMGGGAIPELVDFEKLVVDPDKIKGALMFRELRSPGVLIFDSRIKQVLAEDRPEKGWGIMLKELEVVS